jgi:hypothetical protein
MHSLSCTLFCSQKKSENRPSPTFLGRKIGRYHADVARMRQWIDTCENHHGTLCQSLYDPSLFDPTSDSQGILRFFDLDQKCLVTATPEMKYATLSYIWGSQLRFRLERNSRHSLSQKGALELLRPFLSHNTTCYNLVETTWVSISLDRLPLYRPRRPRRCSHPYRRQDIW